MTLRPEHARQLGAELLRHCPIEVLAPSDEDGAAPPPAIEGYSIVRVIGTGGMGVVYAAREEHPARMVALTIVDVKGFWLPAPP